MEQMGYNLRATPEVSMSDEAKSPVVLDMTKPELEPEEQFRLLIICAPDGKVSHSISNNMKALSSHGIGRMFLSLASEYLMGMDGAIPSMADRAKRELAEELVKTHPAVVWYPDVGDDLMLCEICRGAYDEWLCREHEGARAVPVPKALENRVACLYHLDADRVPPEALAEWLAKQKGGSDGTDGTDGDAGQAGAKA